jgi:hypothetical protein
MSRDPAAKPEPDDRPPPPPHPIVEAFRSATARTYLLVSGGGLLAAAAVAYLYLLSPFAAGALFVVGATGLFLRWTMSPVLFVIVTAYILFFPAGLPFIGGDTLPGVNQIPDGHFRVADLLFVGAALVHLIGLYRFYAAVHIGMPFDAPPAFVKPGVKATRRPTGGVSDPELWRLFARVAVFVVVGQLAWLLVNRLKFDFRLNFPLTTYRDAMEIVGGRGRDFFETSVVMNRALLTVGLFGLVGGGLWFVFWYWRLNRLNRDEARATLLDTEWTTQRRDLNRPEKWRGWQKQKLAGTLPKKGCGSYFLVFGLPAVLFVLFVIGVRCAGGFR